MFSFDKKILVSSLFSLFFCMLVVPSLAFAVAVGIVKADQTITFTDPVDRVFVRNDSFNVFATSDSGLLVTFTSTTLTVCTVSGNTVSVLSAGNCDLVASQAGDNNFNAAVDVTQRVVIAKADQKITFEDPIDQVFSSLFSTSVEQEVIGNNFFDAPTASDSGLLVTLVSTTPSVCIVLDNFLVLIEGAGICELTASQAGDVNFNAAPDVSQSVIINKADQTIFIEVFSEQDFVPNGVIDVFAFSDSGLFVSLESVTPDVCVASPEQTSSSLVIMLKPGLCTLLASQAGDSNFNAATDVIQDILIIGKIDQSITFNVLKDRIFVDGGTFAAPASSDSRLPVTVMSTSPAICVVQNNIVTMINVGRCELTASQAGDTTFNAALDVSQSIVIFDSGFNPVDDIDNNNNGITDNVEGLFGITDSDIDGIPDALEALIGRDVTAFTDTDNDGMPDVGEILVGRDPNNDDNITTASPVIIVRSDPLNLAARDTVSAYRLDELGVSATDNGMTVTPEAYFKQGVCLNALPYNYRVACDRVPNSGFMSGRNDVWWLFTDDDRNWGRNQQTINILPQVNLELDTQVLSADTNEGRVTARLRLSGNTVTGGAFAIPFIIGGSAQNPFDHSLIEGGFQFQANALESDPITITLGNAPSDGNQLIITLDLASNVFSQVDSVIDNQTQFVTVGTKISQTITIRQNSLFPPRLANLTGLHNGSKGRLFDKKHGKVTLSFDLIDPDGGNYSFSWANSSDVLTLDSGDMLNRATHANPVLDISTLPIGRYFIEVKVADETSNATAKISAIMTVIGGITLSANRDSDSDGVPDNVEGFGDADGDGIPDYLDAQNTQANIVPSESGNVSNFLVRVAPSLRLLFGKTATAANRSGIAISLADLATKGDNGQSTTNSNFPNMRVSRIFDYEIEGIDVPLDPNDNGNSVAVILPLLEALRVDTDFFKYDTHGWHRFTENAGNHIAWADFANGIRGNCPEIDSVAYTRDQSQKAGKHCLKVTLQDGGANDADGVINGRIVDPLGVAEPVTLNISRNGSSVGGGGSVDFLIFYLFFVWVVSQHFLQIKRNVRRQ